VNAGSWFRPNLWGEVRTAHSGGGVNRSALSPSREEDFSFLLHFALVFMWRSALPTRKCVRSIMKLDQKSKVKEVRRKREMWGKGRSSRRLSEKECVVKSARACLWRNAGETLSLCGASRGHRSRHRITPVCVGNSS
jgi:hypothetical protein